MRRQRDGGDGLPVPREPAEPGVETAEPFREADWVPAAPAEAGRARRRARADSPTGGGDVRRSRTRWSRARVISGRLGAVRTRRSRGAGDRCNPRPLPGTCCRRYAGEALANHALRSAVFAAAYGRLTGVGYDPELLHVAGLLHDLGLEPSFDSHRLPFEVAGGEPTWGVGSAPGSSEWRRRRRRLIGIVVRRMWHEVDPALDPEGHLLLERADPAWTSPAAGWTRWPAGLRTELMLSRLTGARGRGRAVPPASTPVPGRRPSPTAPRPRRCARVWVERIAANPLERVDFSPSRPRRNWMSLSGR